MSYCAYIKAFMGNGKNDAIKLTIKKVINMKKETVVHWKCLESQKIIGATECVFTLLCFTSYFNILYLINNGMESWHESCIHSGMTYFLICQNPIYWVLICVIQMLYWVNPYNSTHSSRYIVICAFIVNNVKYIIF